LRQEEDGPYRYRGVCDLPPRDRGAVDHRRTAREGQQL